MIGWEGMEMGGVISWCLAVEGLAGGGWRLEVGGWQVCPVLCWRREMVIRCGAGAGGNGDVRNGGRAATEGRASRQRKSYRVGQLELSADVCSSGMKRVGLNCSWLQCFRPVWCRHRAGALVSSVGRRRQGVLGALVGGGSGVCVLQSGGWVWRARLDACVNLLDDKAPVCGDRRRWQRL